MVNKPTDSEMAPPPALAKSSKASQFIDTQQFSFDEIAAALGDTPKPKAKLESKPEPIITPEMLQGFEVFHRVLGEKFEEIVRIYAGKPDYRANVIRKLTDLILVFAKSPQYIELIPAFGELLIKEGAVKEYRSSLKTIILIALKGITNAKLPDKSKSTLFDDISPITEIRGETGPVELRKLAHDKIIKILKIVSPHIQGLDAKRLGLIISTAKQFNLYNDPAIVKLVEKINPTFTDEEIETAWSKKFTDEEIETAFPRPRKPRPTKIRASYTP
ncbi:hypothetical protein KJ632_01255 [Patescibacteria group bacterium]|nr:hypothetical protein [Patescibacteria group bacterium]